MLAGATRLCVRLRGAATTTEDLMRVHIGKVSRRWGGVKGNRGWRGGLKGSGNCKAKYRMTYKSWMASEAKVVVSW